MLSPARISAPVAFTLCLSLWGGCKAVGPDYARPEVELPDAWQSQAAEGVTSGEAALYTWWELLEDEVLDDLIKRAVERNNDLEAAYHRVLQARAVYTIVAGDRIPTLDGVGGVGRGKISDNATKPYSLGTNDSFAAGAEASWEIDVFGKVRRNVEAADYQLGASIEDYRDVLVVLLSDVADTYIELRSVQRRLFYAQRNLADQGATLQLTRDRFDAGIAPGLDVAQAERNLAVTEVSIPELKVLIETLTHRIGVLLGEHPTAFKEMLAPAAPIPTPPETVVMGLPAELLRQRPDVRRAERSLASETALVGVAVAAGYPQFSLDGSFSYTSRSSGDFFENDSQGWFVGPTMRWRLFDGGAVEGGIQVAEEQVSVSLEGYEQTVLVALEEVENAMVRYRRELERRDALYRAVDASQRTVDFVKTLYESGLVDFQNVLDAERELTTQQDKFADSEGNVVQFLVALYRALGGGWDPSDFVLPTDDEMREELQKRADEDAEALRR